jgi:FkbM family methyltransferase
MMERLKNLLLGNKLLQGFWWSLYKLSAKGLNYDRGHIPSANGEAYALKYAWNNLQKHPFVIFDVGANRGQYLKMAFRELRLNREYRIYCFEPQKDAFQSLLKVAGNNPRVIPENIGMSSQEETVTMYKDSPESEFGSLYKSDYRQYNVSLNIPEEVKVSTIDAYCSSHEIKEIDFLKIDVEGHEIEVLRGAKNLIKQTGIHFIQFEFGLAAIESRIFLKDFFNMLKDYHIYRILPHALELINYTEYHELFLTTNYLAKRKPL